jgi:hypothetical protein
MFASVIGGPGSALNSFDLLTSMPAAAMKSRYQWEGGVMTDSGMRQSAAVAITPEAGSERIEYGKVAA